MGHRVHRREPGRSAGDCRKADGGIIAQRRDGFQGHVTGALNGPFVILLEQDRANEADNGVFVGEDDLHGLIAGVLQAMTHAELSETPRRIAGLVVPTLCGIAGGASDCRLQSNEARRPV